MRKAFCCVLLLALSACANGVGQPGSILWKMTANDMERKYYTTDKETDARLQCAQGGYTGEGYEACVQNSLEY